MSSYGPNYGQDPQGQNPYGQPGYGQSPYGQDPYGAGKDPLSQPLRGASPQEAFVRFFKRYAAFSGRSSRSEFWWVYLIDVIINAAFNGLARSSAIFAILGAIYALATIVPSLALGARRLHDVNRSGWWQLLFLLPIIGWIILIVWWASMEKPEGARFDD